MYPNCELVEETIQLATVYAEGWNTTTHRVYDSLGMFIAHIAHRRTRDLNLEPSYTTSWELR